MCHPVFAKSSPRTPFAAPFSACICGNDAAINQMFPGIYCLVARHFD
jgi:hypothetical protein